MPAFAAEGTLQLAGLLDGILGEKVLPSLTLKLNSQSVFRDQFLRQFLSQFYLNMLNNSFKKL